MELPQSFRARAGLGAALVFSLALAFGAGRYSAPTKTVVEVQTRDVVKLVEVVKEVRVQGPVRVVERRVEVPGAAGPTVYVERTTEDAGSTTIKDSVKDIVKDTETKSVVTTVRDVGRFALVGTLGMDVAKPGAVVYGGQLQARVLGPLVVGVGFDSSLRASALVGLSW